MKIVNELEMERKGIPVLVGVVMTLEQQEELEFTLTGWRNFK